MLVLFHIPWSNHLTGSNAIRHGFLFVDMFFMLSGFVMAAAYLNRIKSKAQFCNFLILRFFRLYPIHLVTLLAMVTLELAKVAGLLTGLLAPARTPFSPPNSFHDLFLNISLIQSLGTTDHLSWNSPSWSISCEAAGYVVFGLAVLTGIMGTKAFQVIALPLAVTAYILVVYIKGTLDATYDLGIVRCLAGFCVGIWAFNLTQTTRISFIETRTLSKLAAFLAIWVMVALCFVGGHTEITILPAFLFSLLFLHQDRGVGAKVLCSPSIQFLGLVSYSIYLLHFPILSLIGMVLKRVGPASATDDLGALHIELNPWLGDALVLVVLLAIFVLASLTFDYIEKPWREYGRCLARKIPFVSDMAAVSKASVLINSPRAGSSEDTPIKA